MALNNQYYKNYFWRLSFWVFLGGYYVRLWVEACVNQTSIEAILCLSWLIEENKKLKTLGQACPACPGRRRRSTRQHVPDLPSLCHIRSGGEEVKSAMPPPRGADRPWLVPACRHRRHACPSTAPWAVAVPTPLSHAAACSAPEQGGWGREGVRANEGRRRHPMLR